MAPPDANVPAPAPIPPTHPESSQPHPQSPSSPSANSPTTQTRRSRTSTNASTASATSRLRSASIKLMEASPPPGMWAATGSVASKAPSLSEIRRGSYSESGWDEESQRHKAERRASYSEEGGTALLRRTSFPKVGATPEGPVRPGKGRRMSSGSTARAIGTEPFPTVAEEDMSSIPTHGGAPAETTLETPKYDLQEKEMGATQESKKSSEVTEKMEESASRPAHQHQGQYPNGYVPPPKLPWTRSTVIGLKAFWKWFLTPAGFLITLYGLNVVAWGGMLFLLLCNAAPAMCHPSCNDIQSPRRIWIEIDSQILNALFCVTGFGLFPWRARDLYWWAFWRLGGSKRKQIGIKRLAGIHRGWFRLPGSDALPADASAMTMSPENPAVPIPLKKIPDPPPTGIRAPPTKGWKMDFVVWMNMWNTLFQIVLCFYMWHYNRYDRPSWATGLFVALGCIVAGLGGIMMFVEGKHVKKVEGVPIPKDQYEGQATDAEAQNGVVDAGPAGPPKSY